jgi:hypothetical protein
MQDEDSVVFRLSAPEGQEKTALTWFMGELCNELESKGFAPIGKKVSTLSYAALSYSARGGHISVFVLWHARGDASSWQIRTLYFRPWLRRIFQAQPPQDSVEQLECIRSCIRRFLLARDAHQVQWMSAVDAERRLRQDGALL